MVPTQDRLVTVFGASGFVGSAPVRWHGSEPHERADLARLPAGTYYVRVIDPASGRSSVTRRPWERYAR